MPSCCAWMKNRKCKRWIGRSQFCRCGPVCRNNEPAITSGMARPHCSRQVIGRCHRRHRHQEFLKFMEVVDSTLPSDTGEIHLVLDNYGTHKTPKVVRWFARHPRYQLHFTPTSGSWVNQVERWFAEITEKRIRRGSFTSVPSLEKAIQEYLEYNNEHPKPFVWTADADLILGKIQRLCERISNSPKTLSVRNSSTNV